MSKKFKNAFPLFVDNRKFRNRDESGKYDFEGFDIVCKCGHTLGVHSAKNETNTRPCYNNDCGDGEWCNCKNFKKI